MTNMHMFYTNATKHEMIDISLIRKLHTEKFKENSSYLGQINISIVHTIKIPSVKIAVYSV